MLYNEPKFITLAEKRNALFAGLQSITERQRDTRSHLQSLQGLKSAWLKKHSRQALPKNLEIDLRETTAKLEKLQSIYEEAQQTCDAHGIVVRRCEEFLHDQGVKIPTSSFELTGVPGTNFIGGAGK